MTPRYTSGERVRVRKVDAPGHIRTPWYIRGHEGVIERFCGFFKNPEELAYARPGTPLKALYRVRFAARELWPDYREHAADVVEIEVFQHWLEGA